MATLHLISLCLVFILKVFLIMVISDFISGCIHWWEDTYGNPDWKFLGIGKHLISPNLIHYQKPRDFIKNPYLKRNGAAIFIAFVISLLLYWLVGISLPTAIIFFLYGSQAVEIHAISHRTEKENGKVLSFLERNGYIQSVRHHASHHRSPHKVGYCLMTNWVNPILDTVHFWTGLEWCISKLFGINPLHDHGRV